MKSEAVSTGCLALALLWCGCDQGEFKRQIKHAQEAMEAAQGVKVVNLEDYPDWEDKLKGKINASEEDPLARTNWTRINIVGAYQKFGRKNPKWDKEAVALMEQWIPIVMTPDFRTAVGVQELGEGARKLIDQGCDDPMVAYMRARYLGFGPEVRDEKLNLEWDKVGSAARGSKYPPIRRFWVYLRTAYVLTQSETGYEGFGYFEDALNCLTELAEDPATPELELYIAAQSWWTSYKDRVHYFEAWERLNEALTVGTEPSLAQNLLKGQVYIDWAWQARGGDWARNVTAQGWKGFYERLSTAEEALVSAWYQRPDDWRAPSFMITVELGQGRGRDRMERWFQRAMTANPWNHDAVNRKLYYLEPKWHGSEQDMLAFGRECFDSTNWGGTIPLYLVDAHQKVAGYRDNQEDYYQTPGVWKDIKDSYDLYFKNHSEDYFRRSVFAKWAITCDQPEHAYQTLKDLGTNVVKSAFGTDREYEKEVAWLKSKFRDQEKK